MKMVEVLGGIPITLTNEENSILERVKKSPLYRSKLNMREKEVARKMVSRGILNRRRDDSGTFYTFNGLEDIWRD